MDSDAFAPLLIDNFPAPRRSLRVALVTETYPPEVNGVSLTLERLVSGLHGRNHDLQLVRPRQARNDHAGQAERLHEVLMRGMPIPRYSHLRMGMPAKRALVSMWTRRRPDMVHVATEGPLGWSALQAARKLRLPVSTDFRTNFHAYSRYYGLGWLHKPIASYLRRFHNLADLTMVPTAGLRDELAAMGFDRLEVVARGVDAQRFAPAHRSAALRAEWMVPPDAGVVLYVGRLAAEKNLGLLARTFDAMQAVDPRLRLVVVGEGPERETLQTLCPQAILVGARHGDDLARHYASADIFVFPSLTETFGNVTIEALSSGLAVLAFDHAAAAELIRHGENGLLAPFGDEEAFVRRACDLVTSADLVRRLGYHARATAQGRDWSHIVQQVEALWLRLLPLQPGRARGGDGPLATRHSAAPDA